ncbi:MAG: hypothetical protein ACRDYZ_12550 [Acidimicrobiales bacterium]
MEGLQRGLIPSVVTLVGALALVVASGTGARAATTGAPGPVQAPGGLQRQALTAVSGFLGDGRLQPVSASGPAVSSTVTTPQGPIPVVEWTLTTSDASGPVVLVLAWLGDTQLVVNAVRPDAGFSGETLVLAPGSSTIQGAYPLGRSVPSTSATTPRGVVDAPLAVPSTFDGCYPAPQNPTVIGSIYGPLVEGEGIVDCAQPRTLAMIVSLYEGFSRVGTASGSTYGYYYALDAFYPCRGISGTSSFITTELWSVNGALQPGAQSGWSALACA